MNLAAKQLLTLRGLLVYTGADSRVHRQGFARTRAAAGARQVAGPRGGGADYPEALLVRYFSANVFWGAVEIRDKLSRKKRRAPHCTLKNRN